MREERAFLCEYLRKTRARWYIISYCELGVTAEVKTDVGGKRRSIKSDTYISPPHSSTCARSSYMVGAVCFTVREALIAMGGSEVDDVLVKMFGN